MEHKRAEFDDIRPFNDDEVAPKLAELVEDPEFVNVFKTTLTDMSWDKVKSILLSFRNIYDFQHTVIKETVFDLLSKTAGKVDCSGFENISKTENYTYISNHRDIVLDASILCVLLSEAGYDTCEICLGDNLLASPWITTILRLNKGVVVKRGVGTRQQYEVSKQLSEYIHYTINEKKQSIWIAQREGRAKNSDDKTQSSVLKMLSLGGSKSFLENLMTVSIAPVALSYEYDPCDFLKAREYQLKRDNPEYKKTTEDDVINMRTGILGQKGNIHFQIGRPINTSLEKIDKDLDKNELVTQVSALIDKEIYLNYHFYPINYVAYDKLWGNNEFFRSKYTDEEMKDVEKYFLQRLDMIDIPEKDTPFLMEKLLEMYAFPVKNYLNAIEE